MVADARECSIEIIQVISSTDSIHLTLDNANVKCQYTVSVKDRRSDSKDCHQDREHFECQTESLDPGTWYDLDITSMLDEKLQSQHTVTLQTSKISVY